MTLLLIVGALYPGTKSVSSLRIRHFSRANTGVQCTPTPAAERPRDKPAVIPRPFGRGRGASLPLATGAITIVRAMSSSWTQPRSCHADAEANHRLPGKQARPVGT